LVLEPLHELAELPAELFEKRMLAVLQDDLAE